ncbi:MAG TPA: hypothetical protein VFT74_06680 [Isosphaeraceae bacterium]|nr:hypothetical protein [Isosphaeraceae bacterium]
MAPHVLIGRHAKVTLWDDLADLMPGGPVGLITHVAGDGDDVELTVQLRGFRMTFHFLLGEVELLPSDYTEAVMFTATHPARQGDMIHLHPSLEAARLEVGSRPCDGRSENVARVGRITGRPVLSRYSPVAWPSTFNPS